MGDAWLVISPFLFRLHVLERASDKLREYYRFGFIVFQGSIRKRSCK